MAADDAVPQNDENKEENPMRKYEEPKLEVQTISIEDVITDSITLPEYDA